MLIDGWLDRAWGADPLAVLERIETECDELGLSEPDDSDAWRDRWFATVQAEVAGHRGTVQRSLAELEDDCPF